MDAPMVYRGSSPELPLETVARVSLYREADQVLLMVPVVALPPPEPVVKPPEQAAAANAAPTAAKPAHSAGLFHRLGTFFATLFH
jgi:hypothetical protein